MAQEWTKPKLNIEEGQDHTLVENQRFWAGKARRFARDCGDPNPLHQRECPIVPTGMVVQWILGHLYRFLTENIGSDYNHSIVVTFQAGSLKGALVAADQYRYKLVVSVENIELEGYTATMRLRVYVEGTVRGDRIFSAYEGTIVGQSSLVPARKAKLLQ
ncbi:MAG: hypothetical protein V1826_02335 [bacterium]